MSSATALQKILWARLNIGGYSGRFDKRISVPHFNRAGGLTTTDFGFFQKKNEMEIYVVDSVPKPDFLLDRVLEPDFLLDRIPNLKFDDFSRI